MKFSNPLKLSSRATAAASSLPPVPLNESVAPVQLLQAGSAETGSLQGRRPNRRGQSEALGQASPPIPPRPPLPASAPGWLDTAALPAAPARSKGGILASLRSRAYNAGIGINETFKVSNWAGRHATATPKRSSTVRQEGEGPPSVPKALAAAAEAALRPTLPEARAPSNLDAMLGDMDSSFSWCDAVRTHCKGSDWDKVELANELGRIKVRHGLRDAEVVVLTKCVLSRFSDARNALDALTGLRDLDILGQVVHADPSPSESSRKAWQLAAQLQAVPGIGLHLLGQLSHREGESETGTFKTDQRPLVRAYFEAAQEVARKGGHPLELDPHTVYSRGAVRTAIEAVHHRFGEDAWPGRDGAQLPTGLTLTLAEKALLAVRDAANPSINATHGCAFAMHMVRGGMLTDERFDSNGELSEYHKAESRARKTLGKHLDRALGTEEKSLMLAFAERLIPHKNKSPFFAHDRILSKDKVGFGLSHDSGVHQGRAVKDMIGVVKMAHQDIRGYRETTGLRRRDIEHPTANHLARIRHECRLAILNVADSETALLPRFANAEPLSEAQLLKAEGQVLPRLTTRHEMSGQQKAALAEQVESILRQENLGLTPQTLLAWGHAAGGPSNVMQLREKAQAPVTGGEPNWAVFEAGYQYVTQQVQPRVDTPPLKDATRQAAGAQLADMIRDEELGSGFKLQNGGLSHGRTGVVTSVATRMLLGGVGAVRMDLGGGVQRTVTFESGVDPARSFIKVGVSTLKQTQAGLGGAAGIGLGEEGTGGVGIGIGAKATRAYEVVHEEGTIFGFPRHLSGGAVGDRELGNKKAQLAELLVAVAGGQERRDELPRPANPEDQGSLIKAAYQAFGEQISVGRYEMNATNRKTVLSIGTETYVRAARAKINVPEFELSRRQKTNRTGYNESSGSLRVKRVAVEVASEVNAEVSVAGIQGLSLTKRGADFSRAGTIQTTHRVMLDGEELSISFATTDYLKPGDFVHALESGLDTMARDKSAEYFKDRHAVDAAMSSRIEKRTLVDFAARILNERDLSSVPQLYSEFGGAVVAANLLEADAAVSRLLGDEARAQVAHRKASSIHEDPANQEGRLLFSTSTRSLGANVGWNGLFGATHSRLNEFAERSARYT